MILYGLADDLVSEIIEFFPSKAKADEALRQVLADEPDFADILRVVAVDLDAVPWAVSSPPPSLT